MDEADIDTSRANVAKFTLVPENIECPIGYTKCPESYCIADRFICDGIENCPFGEDEEDCGKLGLKFKAEHAYIKIIILEPCTKTSLP